MNDGGRSECPKQPRPRPAAFEPDVALNAIVRERRSEFRLPNVVEKGLPSAAEVHQNQERWGLWGDGSKGLGSK